MTTQVIQIIRGIQKAADPPTYHVGMHIYDDGVEIGFVQLKEIDESYERFYQERDLVYERWNRDIEWRERMIMECLL